MMTTIKAGDYTSLSVNSSSAMFTLDVNIKILENNRYDLTYTWYERGILANPENIEEHVFGSNNNDLHHEGEIVAGNAMVNEMITHLIMPDSELEKCSGFSSAGDYRYRILNSIKLFWD